MSLIKTPNVRKISALLLFLVGINAVYSGILLIMDPTGGFLLLPEIPDKDAFDDYFIPGLVLFVVIGILSIVAGIAVLLKWRNHSSMVLVQGYLIIGWTFIQIIILEQMFWLQILAGIAGLVLVLSGTRLEKNAKKKNRYRQPFNN